MTHTPGPWKVVLSNQGYEIQTTEDYQDAGNLHLATVWENVEDSDEVEANARLIAAAPDLLKVLQSALEYIQVGAPRSPLAVDVAAVIAKATGN